VSSFSTRTPHDFRPNRLNLALQARRASGEAVLDLTLSNPTRAGLVYPDEEILAALCDARSLTYEPTPRGLREAREAIAAHHAAQGQNADPERLILAGSTSEAYGWLFKLLCEPGDEVLVPKPSYPLFECLATLDAVRAVEYSLPEDLHWGIDFDALERCRTARTRAVIVVNPNNPTGAFLKRAEWRRLQSWAALHGLAIVADEVFFDYAWSGVATSGSPEATLPHGHASNPACTPASFPNRDQIPFPSRDREGAVPDHNQVPLPVRDREGAVPGPLPVRDREGAVPTDSATPHIEDTEATDSAPVSSLEATGEALVFTLSGLSKVAGLPQMKLGWIHASGPRPLLNEALERLEWIADAYLPVSAPIQHAAVRWMELVPQIQSAIRARCLENLSIARGVFSARGGARTMDTEGGWCVVIDVPRFCSEEEWTLRMLERDGVLLQPGFFYDFEREALLVASLLPAPAVFRECLERLERILIL
jgi:aspartate/methionine/tyrosine aminotransferase